MKRIFLFCLCFLLSMSSALAEAEDHLLERGLAMIQDMDELAENEAYCQALSGTEQITELAQQMGEGDYAEPKHVYRITVNAETLLDMADGIELSDLSETVQDQLKKRLFAAIATQFVATDGALALATSTVLTVSSAFIEAQLTEDVIYAYEYDGEYSAIVTFVTGESSVIQSSAMFIRSELLTTSLDQFTSLNADNISIETIL